MLQYVKPESKKLVRRKLKEAQNFFKHADLDHESTLQFNPSSTELMAMDACAKYREITGENPPLFQIYSGWMMMTRPEVYELPAEQLSQLSAAAEIFLPIGRTEYFADHLPVVMKVTV
jgi:hypothetical protein